MPQVIKSTTQNHLEIEDVLENLILLKDGSASIVLQTNAINFGLLSEEEQDATIYAYAALLNSLTFTIQILIRSETKDISSYLRLLEEQQTKQSDTLKKRSISSYRQFITSLVTERNVLEKKFYIVIPFSTLELGVTQSMTSSLGPKKKSLPFDKSYIIEKSTTNLEPKRDHVLRQLGRLGLSARQLKTQELIQLVFSMYNPGSGHGQKISNTKDYTVPLVQPAYIKPKEVIMADSPQNSNQPSSPTANTPTPTTPSTPPSPTSPSPATPATPQAPTPSTPTPPPGPAPSVPEPSSPTANTPTPTTPSTPPSPTSPSPATPTTPTTPTDPGAGGGVSPSDPPMDAQNAINSAASDLAKSPGGQ